MENKILIAEISDAECAVDNWKVRKASRGILVNKDQIALLNVSNENYFKLPGGGLKGRETSAEAFSREVEEETGYQANILNYYGVIIEYRKEFKLVQISYIFSAITKGGQGKIRMEPNEIKRGFRLEWHNIEEAIKLVENCKPKSYEGKIIQKRDLAILNFYKSKT